VRFFISPYDRIRFVNDDVHMGIWKTETDARDPSVVPAKGKRTRCISLIIL
jgi:hypothetical protein